MDTSTIIYTLDDAVLYALARLHGRALAAAGESYESTVRRFAASWRRAGVELEREVRDGAPVAEERTPWVA